MTSHADPPGWDATKLSTNVAHPARVYDYLLGGKDNFAADRALAEEMKRRVPGLPKMILANRAWMRHATRFLVGEAGIRQILDIGTGLPTTPNLHDVAQELAPVTRVLYVDNDPLVLVHARALLVGAPEGRVEYLDADVRDVGKILNSPELANMFDLTRPIAVMAASVLMLLPDEADPWAIVRTLRDWMPQGSYLAISHPTADFDPNAMADVVSITRSAGVTFVPRKFDEISRTFGDWDMIDPGLVPVLDWRPTKPVTNSDAAYYWAGVARKPNR